MEEYGGGAIEARHGYIPIWLLVVYFVLAVWGSAPGTLLRLHLLGRPRSRSDLYVGAT